MGPGPTGPGPNGPLFGPMGPGPMGPLFGGAWALLYGLLVAYWWPIGGLLLLRGIAKLLQDITHTAA